MIRVPWAPFNLGIFLIIVGVLMLASFTGVSPLNPGQSFPLAITVFGVWLALVAFIMAPPISPYKPPRLMVFGWGALLAALGVLWFVGVYAGPALPVVSSVLLIVAGIGAVGYSLTRAEAKKGSIAVA